MQLQLHDPRFHAIRSALCKELDRLKVYYQPHALDRLTQVALTAADEAHNAFGSLTTVNLGDRVVTDNGEEGVVILTSPDGQGSLIVIVKSDEYGEIRTHLSELRKGN